ncbi:GTP cyclohydrolase I FolE [Candidatus Peregrinibacteria bacterium]|nr:MAG: GTP cyclohydrolase I FolE [Candidatus Peregrinibacteria bacterium]
MDIKQLENLCKELLEGIGENTNREGLQETPRRFAHAWKEMISGYGEESKLAEMCTTFEGENYDEMIVVKNIEFHSLCEHHLLPIIGSATVGYIPEKKIIGVSKIPRIVEIFARRLQNQERLTMQIADTLVEVLQPKGVAVLISATHLCMTMRGVHKQNSVMETSAVRGIFRKDSRTRAEFFGMGK